MKKDQYFNLEVNLLNDDNIAGMMSELDAAEALGIYVMLLLHLRTKDNYEASCTPLLLRAFARRHDLELDMLEKVLHDYNLFEVDEERQTFRAPYLDRVMQRLEEKWRMDTENGKKGGRPKKRAKCAETPATKGRKPNETQERREEEKIGITPVVNNSSNISEERKTAAVVVRTSDSVNDRGNEIVSPRLDPVQSTSCFCSAHGLSLLVPRVKYGLPTACRNSPTVCGNSPAACGNFHPRLLLQGFFQSGNRLFRVFFFFEQSDELTADDSSGSVFASCLECCFIGDTKSHHQRIVQMHTFNLFEVSPFLFVEILLRSGGCC